MTRKMRIEKLFLAMVQLSACTFGGGYVIVPMMQRKFVQELSWLDDDEMMDLAVIAQTAPGAIAVNAAILVGYRILGAWGAAAAAAGTSLPPLVIISIISYFYAAFIDNGVIRLVMTSMQAGATAVICSLAANLFLDIKNTRRKMQLALLAAAFIAMHFCGAGIVPVLLCCAVYGVLDSYIRHRRGLEN